MVQSVRMKSLFGCTGVDCRLMRRQNTHFTLTTNDITSKAFYVSNEQHGISDLFSLWRSSLWTNSPSMFYKLSNGRRNVGARAHFPKVPSPERRIYIISVSDFISLEQAKLMHNSLRMTVFCLCQNLMYVAWEGWLPE